MPQNKFPCLKAFYLCLFVLFCVASCQPCIASSSLLCFPPTSPSTSPSLLFYPLLSVTALASLLSFSLPLVFQHLPLSPLQQSLFTPVPVEFTETREGDEHSMNNKTAAVDLKGRKLIQNAEGTKIATSIVPHASK